MSDYLAIVKQFAKNPHVSQGKKGFGYGALKVNEKIFALMSSKEKFVVRLSKERVAELVATRKADYFEPRPGIKMKGWAVIPKGKTNWSDVAQEAYRYVKSLPK